MSDQKAPVPENTPKQEQKAVEAAPVVKTPSAEKTPETPPAEPQASVPVAEVSPEKEVPPAKIESRFGELRPGYTIKVHQKIKQGDKDRIQVFEGVIIAEKGKSESERMITVRRIAPGGYGVEKIFPLASPSIPKIEVVHKPSKVRRAKLYYVRESVRKIKELREK